MLFDFIGMQAMCLSLARADAGPLAEALTARPAVSPDAQWATFVRNHDELTLDKLSEEERLEVLAAFGPEDRMRPFGRGLRRRLPSMLDGDPRRDPESLLSFMKVLIRRYRESPELGWGAFEVLEQPHRSVLAHMCRWDDGTMVAVHNLGPEPCTVPLTLPGCDSSHRCEDLLREATSQVSEDGGIELPLEGYGYRWLRVLADGSRRLL